MKRRCRCCQNPEDQVIQTVSCGFIEAEHGSKARSSCMSIRITEEKENPEKFLSDFHGYLVTDGYQDTIPSQSGRRRILP